MDVEPPGVDVRARRLEEGTAVNPPATEALQELPVTVEGRQVMIA